MKTLSIFILCALGLCAGVVHSGAESNSKMSRPLAGGIVAIWLQSPSIDSETLLKQPFVKGGQTVVQWAQVEPEKGKYDFSALELQLADYAKRKLPVTVQLNGNRKPHYLFDEVPYVKEGGREVTGFRQVENWEGTLMYWHRAHEQAYFNCLTALRDYLARSPYKSSILGLRVNLNAFGTEYVTLVPPAKATEYHCKGAVDFTAGLDTSIPYNGYNQADSLEYVRHVLRKHVELFTGVVPVFIRCTVDREVLKEFLPNFENGTLGLFETLSCFAPFTAKNEDDEEWIRRYCKSGQTLGYAESFSDAWGTHTFKDEYPISPPQAFYWRLLSDLHKGISYIAVYGRDLNVALTGKLTTSTRTLDGKSSQLKYDDAQSGFNYKHEFHEAVLFADRYAGYHARPEQAPGAWIAFRESDAVGNARSSGQKLKLAGFTGDYTYLMERLPDKSAGVMKIGPDQVRYGAFARRLPGQETMRLKADSRFLQSLAEGGCRVRVIFFDETPGASFSVSAGGQTWKVPMRGSQTWETAMFDATSTQFQPLADGSQFAIQTAEAPVCFHMLAIERK